MVCARIIGATAAIVMGWCAVADAAGPVRPFQLGLWSGGAYTDDRTGAFTHCSAGIAYDSGVHLFVLVTGDWRWWLGIINPDWRLKAGAGAPPQVRLDDGTPIAGEVTIPSGQLLLLALSDAARLGDALRRAARLVITLDGQAYSFKLHGPPAVLEQLSRCVRTSVAMAARTQPSAAPAPAAGPAAVPAADSAQPPAASAAAATQPQAEAGARESAATAQTPPGGAEAAPASPSPATGAAPTAQAAAVAAADHGPANPSSPSPAAGGSPAGPPLTVTLATPLAPLPVAAESANAFVSASETTREEIRLANEFVSKAGLIGARLVDAEKPPALAEFAAVWRAGDTAGAVKILPAAADASGITVASHLIAIDPQLCPGDFSTGRFRTVVGGDVVFSAALSCSDAHEQRTTEYFVAPRHRGGFAVFAVIRSKAAGGAANFDRNNIATLSKAAEQAVAERESEK